MSALTITNENFNKEIMEGKGTVLLDFWAEWCGPCRASSPIIDAIADEKTDIKVGKVNIDEQRALAERFSIKSVPTLVVMKDGKVVKRTAGARSKSQLLEMLG